MKRTIITILAAGLLAGGGGTGAAELIVSAAASLTNALSEVAREFERANSPHKVILNFASSGALLQQIYRGAPVDVFASADEDTMDQAEKENLIMPSSRIDFAGNTLVLVAPSGAEVSVSRLEDLRKGAIRRIAISNTQTVPAGKYSRQALEAAGLFAELKDKYINTQNVRQSLDYVARGEVDAGFVYGTDAAVMADKVKVLLEVPTGTAIRYPIAVVRGSGKEAVATRFLEFVRSDAGQRILRKHGFRSVD
jgi:molybdate transport system substrate-binding protein